MTASPDFTELTYFRGRVALYAVLRALGIGEGDEVATQAFTCLAVPEGILASGARPLWVDVEHGGVNMAPDDLERRLGLRTRAVVVQHTFGIPADVQRLMSIATARGLPVIEDCCHTLRSRLDGRTVGSFGAAAFYSYEWGKPVVAGVGGSARANDAALRTRLRNEFGSFREPPFARVARTQLQYAGFNLLFRPSLYWPLRTLFRRLSALGAAEGNYNPVGDGPSVDFALRMARSLKRRLQRRLARLDLVTAHAEALGRAYRERIVGPAVRHLPTQPGAWTVPARYPLFTDCKAALLEAARGARVELAEWYATPIHPLGRADWIAVGYVPGSCPNAEAAAASVVSLPTHLRVGRRDAEWAIRFLNTVRPA